MNRTASRAGPSPLGEGEFLVDVTTVHTSLATSKEATDLDDFATEPFGLVLDLANQFP